MMSCKAALIPRVFASVTSFIAGSIMLFLAHQTKTFMGVDKQVNFGDIAPYMCFVIANYLVGGYSALLCVLPSNSQLWKTAVAIDALFLVGLTSSCSAALSIVIMENNGNIHARWLPICNSFPNYCFRVFWAIGFGYLGALIHLIMHMLKIHEGFNPMLL